MISALVKYSTQSSCRQGVVTLNERAVGFFAMRMWKRTVVMMKRPKTTTWIPRPARTMLLPSSWSDLVFADVRTPPPRYG